MEHQHRLCFRKSTFIPSGSLQAFHCKNPLGFLARAEEEKHKRTEPTHQEF